MLPGTEKVPPAPCEPAVRAGGAAAGHQKAIGAVARHLAEATCWLLRGKEEYREPGSATGT